MDIFYSHINEFCLWWQQNGQPSRDRIWDNHFKEMRKRVDCPEWVNNVNHLMLRKYLKICQAGFLPDKDLALFIKTVTKAGIEEKKPQQKVQEVVSENVEEKEYDEKDLRINYLEQRNKILQNEKDQILKMVSVEHRIIEAFEEKIKEFKPVQIVSTPKFFGKSDKIKNEVIVLISDLHAGEEVRPEEVFNLNEYNLEICVKRLKIFYDHLRILLNQLSSMNFDTINLHFLGDMVNGMIHEELKSSTPEVDQVIIPAEIFGQMIEDLAQDFIVNVVAVDGNHARFTKKPPCKKRYNNFDYMMYKFIETYCRHINHVSFNIPRASMAIQNIQGYNCLLRHGDCKANGYAGIPHYGIMRASSKLTQLLGMFCDTKIHYEEQGHFHTQNQMEKPGGEVILNGTFKGVDEFALNAIHTATEPRQTLLMMHADWGKTVHMPIYCVKSRNKNIK